MTAFHSMDTIGKHFRELTAKAFASHGFHEAEVLSRWPEIVGDETAKMCRPERLKWTAPKMGEQPTATLHLRASAGRALELQYAESRIIERINSFLGYAAIARLKIKTGAVPPPAPPAPRPQARSPDTLTTIADPDLQAALGRLAAGVMAARSPQAK